MTRIIDVVAMLGAVGFIAGVYFVGLDVLRSLV